MHRGFRLGLGLKLKLTNNLENLKTSCRSYTHFPNEEPMHRKEPYWLDKSAYDILANALDTAIGRCDQLCCTDNGSMRAHVTQHVLLLAIATYNRQAY